MAQKLDGKVAVITGGGGGIGRATAIAMAVEGAKIVVNDIAKDTGGNNNVDKVVNEIKETQGIAVANYDNVSTMAGGENIIKTAVSNFGRIDILVNTAGNFISRPIVDFTENEWDSIIAVHLKGHFSCCKYAAKEMIKQKSGRIINISSRAAFTYQPGPLNSIAYAAAKAGILGFSAQLSSELKDHGITVNSIIPSANTQLFPGQGRRFGGGIRETPDFVAPIITYLATDEAKNITAQTFYACGGDLCIFGRPMQLPGPHMFIRKIGKWTVDELCEVIPPMVI